MLQEVRMGNRIREARRWQNGGAGRSRWVHLSHVNLERVNFVTHITDEKSQKDKKTR
jgi:hypothetical protein